MTMERRAFAILLGLVVLAGPVPGQAGEADKYLPNDAEAVVTLNVKQILSAPVVEALLDKAKEKLAVMAELQKAQQDIGFDPLRDIERVTFALGQDPRKVVVLIQGRFDAAKIHAKAPQVAQEKKDVLKINQAGAYTIYEIKPPEENKPVFVAVLDNSMVAVSQDQNCVLDVLDKKAGKRTATLQKDLQNLLTRADSQQSISILALPGPLAVTGQPLVQKIKTIAGNITVTDEVKVELVLNARNAQDAKSIAAELNENLDQVKALVENAAQVDNRLKPAVDAVNTLKVAAQGGSVTLTGQISKDVCSSIGKLLQK